MGDTNYFSGIVKILENPIQSITITKTLKIIFQAELPQIRQNKIVSVVVWGNLVNEVKDYYQINDYILIEGYTSIEKNKNPQKTVITVLKVYPFLLK